MTRPPQRGARAPLGAVALVAITALAVLASSCTDSAVGDDDAGGPAPDETASAPAVVADGGASVVRFTDVATEVGIDFRHGAFRWSVTADPNAMMGAGLCWVDADADGWLDLFVVNTWSDGEWSRWNELGDLPTTRLFRNDGGRFVDATDDFGAGVEVRGNGCVAADLDNDGFTDLYVTTERANVLLWNDGGDSFVEDDGSAGASAYGWHAGAAVGDVNGDGWPDIFVAGYADLNRRIPDATRGFPNTYVAEPDLLLLNQGDQGTQGAAAGRPTFVDVASEIGIEAAQIDYGLGAVLSDADRDGDLDLYVANDTHPNRLYLNEADAGAQAGFRFVDRGLSAGVDDDNAGMGIAAADYDTDGRPDLVVTNMATQGHDVFTSDGGSPPVYSSALARLGLSEIGQVHTGWGTVLADLDLDGDLDLVLAHGAIPVNDLDADREPVQIFEQLPLAGEGPRFEEVADPVEGSEGGRYLARGLAAADYDNDGDVDLAIGTIGGQLALLRNDGASGRWLSVAASPPIPGTLITVTADDGTVQTREILAGSSYLSSEDGRAHFGFGDGQPARVEVRWPDGTTVAIDDVAPDRLLTVKAP